MLLALNVVFSYGALGCMTHNESVIRAYEYYD
ncbi:hypothetical protein OsccyDRAFT_0106 [Leptolyngbyaceae cyanobacterium JSC-12]|nr:hypothetical protein OsccyDRAFT_0106 [Leptolyngbyaceae cyanobacterium JSC-12]